MTLTKEQIFAADDCSKTETVSVPEWGGDVIVGVISGTQRDAFDLHRGERKDDKNIRALMVAMACRDEKGNPLFTVEDVAALGKKSSVALDRVFLVAAELNRMSGVAIEDTAKNS